MNSPRVKHHALEGAVLDVFIIIGNMDPPLASFIRLKRCIESAIVFTHLKKCIGCKEE